MHMYITYVHVYESTCLRTIRHVAGECSCLLVIPKNTACLHGAKERHIYVEAPAFWNGWYSKGSKYSHRACMEPKVRIQQSPHGRVKTMDILGAFGTAEDTLMHVQVLSGRHDIGNLKMPQPCCLFLGGIHDAPNTRKPKNFCIAGAEV